MLRHPEGQTCEKGSHLSRDRGVESPPACVMCDDVSDMRQGPSGTLVELERLRGKSRKEVVFMCFSTMPEPVQVVVIVSSWKVSPCVFPAYSGHGWMASETTEIESEIISAHVRSLVSGKLPKVCGIS